MDLETWPSLETVYQSKWTTSGSPCTSGCSTKAIDVSEKDSKDSLSS